jgi:hypothetical protein
MRPTRTDSRQAIGRGSPASSVAFFMCVFLVSICNCQQAPAQNSSAPLPQGDGKPVGSEAAPSTPIDEVKAYLWSVYQRSKTKTDSHGDFTWKDGAAAARAGMPLEDYVIGGMDPDFREQLFAMGHAMDAAKIDWTILSGFRDDYRQSLAAGLKARVDNSFHGGSAATGGYGHGCAADLASSDGLSNDQVWTWLDRHGLQFGLSRAIRQIDPPHVLPSKGWHESAARLRNERLGIRPEPALAAAPKVDEPIPPSAAGGPPGAALSEDQYNCARPKVVEDAAASAAHGEKVGAKSKDAKPKDAKPKDAKAKEAKPKEKTAGGVNIHRESLPH